MAWGDSWGRSPREYHEKLAKAFFEGRELGSIAKGTFVGRGSTYMEYVYHHHAIACYTPPSMMPEAVARALLGKEPKVYEQMVFRVMYNDKATMRHLLALGVEAEYQGGKKPFLAFGADIMDSEWRTVEECKALPKWTEPPKVSVRARPVFVNKTLPLFA